MLQILHRGLNYRKSFQEEHKFTKTIIDVIY